MTSSRTATWRLAVCIALMAVSVDGSADSIVDGAEPSYPGDKWPQAAPADVVMDGARLAEARKYALTGGGSGLVTRHGRLVMTWGDVGRRYDLKSSTKSIGVTSLGLAIMDGRIKLSDKARKHHPTLGVPPDSNKKTGWLDQITILHLATQTAGFEKPGGYRKLLFKPGTQWHYSDGGPNWLAECITLEYKRDLRDVMFDRVFTPLGITGKDLTWRNNAYRQRTIAGVARREFGSGISANVNAMARIGYLYLRGGKWKDKQIIPRSFVDACRTTVKGVVGLPEHDKGHGNASDHYGLLWWNNADGTLKNVPRDAYWSWGLYDSLIIVIPSLDVVVARAGKSWSRKGWSGHYGVLQPFFGPIVASVKDKKQSNAGGLGPVKGNCKLTIANCKLPIGGQESDVSQLSFCNCQFAICNSVPLAVNASFSRQYLPSDQPRIQKLTWARRESIIRLAKGSDNWPVTWGDDDALYTAYGDGRGFKPYAQRKLSMGFARVTGQPPDIKGANLRSSTGETIGDGRRGKKASGILMVNGVLYLWARNAGNAQLATSRDRGRTWAWADWKFTTSFGAPTFLNFGRNYTGVPDAHRDYVYIYSFDSDSAYKPADRFVLARVPTDRITQRDAYEFFKRLDERGRPQWSSDVRQRGAVCEHKGACYRSGVSYNAGLKRYVWAQITPGGDTRFKGGFRVCEAAEPWGLWRTVFETKQWDVGPGESAGFPTKWMSKDGRTMHLVFSGDDCFCVRKVTMTLRGDSEPQ